MSAPTAQYVEAMLKITDATSRDADRARDSLEEIRPLARVGRKRGPIRDNTFAQPDGGR